MNLEKKPVSAKVRLDLLLLERGLVPSRERARALILAGRVLVREQKVDKSGTTVPADAPIRLLGEEQAYVSRGGVKLEAALKKYAGSWKDERRIDCSGPWPPYSFVEEHAD